MKPLLSIIALLFLTGTAQSQLNTCAITRTDGDHTIYYDKVWHEIPDKDTASFYRHVTYKNGLPVGEFRDYFMSGQIQNKGRMIIEFENSGGLLDGRTLWYYENGRVSRDATYDHGVLRNSTDWGPDGKVTREIRSKGSKLILAKSYPSEGVVYECTNPVRIDLLTERTEGVFTKYVNGRKVEVAEWKNGEKIKVLWTEEKD